MTLLDVAFGLFLLARRVQMVRDPFERDTDLSDVILSVGVHFVPFLVGAGAE